MLIDQTQQFLSTIHNDNSTDEEVNNAISEFLSLFNESNETDKELALDELTGFLTTHNPKYLDALATVIGYLFEIGYSPDSVSNRLLQFFEHLLRSSTQITQALAEKVEALNIEALDEEDKPDLYELFKEHFPAMAAQNPAAARAWEILDKTWCCGIAFFSVSKEARREAQKFRPLADQNAEFHGGAHWFAVMLSVLDEEPFIAIEREKLAGVRGKMSGVVENFQLLTLLTDVFPSGWFAGSGNSKQIIENAKGLGEQALDLTAEGHWNMYDWTAVRPDLTLPDHTNTGSIDNWIWGEGRPEDIPLFEGYRVILLGKSSYQRTWRAQRMFNKLEAELKVEQKLSRGEVQQWLKKMAEASK
jgi:hypothetical protein